MSKSSKNSRVRAAQEGGSNHTSIPFGDDDFSIVRAREFRNYQLGPGGGFLQPDQQTVTMSGATNNAWLNASDWEPPDDDEFALDPDGSLNDQAVGEANIMNESDPPKAAPKKKKRKKSIISKRPHRIWKEQRRASYLDEICRNVGRGDFLYSNQCPDCLLGKSVDPQPAEYRCESDCFLSDLTCKSCCVRRHKRHPFHRIQKWEGTHFVPVSLKSLGLKMVLNHTGMYCENPIPCHKSMVVLHTNGFHDIDLYYCGCGKGEPQHVQLLRRRLYPATHLVIKTCATFELLNHLHKMSLTTKASLYDFYRGLEKLTDNTGLTQLRSRYRELFRMLVQWGHLLLLMWGGRAHDPAGPDQTKAGELALPCPSCPRPGINLPDGWDKVPNEKKFLYMLFVAMDANFRLKNQIVSNYDQDPGLGIGMSYMVGREQYESFILDRANDSDVSSCVGFQALAQANTRFSRGLRYTGVGAVFCGRSEMVLPQSVGNLAKGERYSSMDYVFGSAIQGFKALSFILCSYDIACQWFTNLFKRMNVDDWPTDFEVSDSTHFIPAVPKLHEPMHETKDHQVYSLNYIPGCGLSDMECPERFWGPHNVLGNSTKTMGPGNRQDIMDIHFHFWNWLKYISMGATLLSKYRAALADRNLQKEAHRGLTESLSPSLVKKWERLCREWEEEELPKTKPNPYDVEGATITEAQAKKDLEEDEKKRLAAGGVALHPTGPVEFIEMALAIEDSQRRLRRFAKDDVAKATAKQDGGLNEQRNQLTSRIQAWEQLLPVYLPGLVLYHKELYLESGINLEIAAHPEDHILWLPSQIRQSNRHRVCVPGLTEIEEKRRTAQCNGSLESLRLILRIKSRLLHFKDKNIRGQKNSTRSRAIIDRVHNKARSEAARYRQARAAKLALSGSGKWELTLRELADDDIRSYEEPKPVKEKKGRPGTMTDAQREFQGASSSKPTESEDFTLFERDRDRSDGTGETRKELSWIWLGQRAAAPGAEGDVILRAEWSKSRARVARSKEEVSLLKEEMRRVLEFLQWRSDWWIGLIGLRNASADQALREGLHAHATASSNLQLALANKFRAMWHAPLKDFDKDEVTITPNGSILEISKDPANTLTSGGVDDHENGEDDEDEDEDEGGDNDGESGNPEGFSGLEERSIGDFEGD